MSQKQDRRDSVIRRHNREEGRGLFPVRTGIYFFVMLDTAIGILNSFAFLLSFDSKTDFAPGEKLPSLLLMLINTMIVIPALYAVSGTAQSDVRKVRYYYISKAVQLILRPILALWTSKAECGGKAECDSQYWLAMFMFSVLVGWLHMYELWMLFSYINLVAKGDSVLANNGLEVVRVIEHVKHHASILQPPTYTGIVAGASIRDLSGKVSDIDVGQALPIAAPACYPSLSKTAVADAPLVRTRLPAEGKLEAPVSLDEPPTKPSP